MNWVSVAFRQRTKWRAPAHLAVVTIALQGAPIISQVIASIIVPLTIIGSIRTIESALPVVVLLASLGASSLAVREIAAVPDDASRRTMSRNLLLLPLAGTTLFFAVGLVARLVVPRSWTPWIDSALPLLPLALLINVNRCVGGIAQGWGRTATISAPVAFGSALAIGCHVAGAWLADMRGWIAGRYIAEIMILACLARTLPRAKLAAIHMTIDLQGFLRLAGGAVILNLAFVFRASADALPLLSLAAAGGSPTDIGAFGIATLVVTMIMLPIAVLSQITLPALSRAAANRETSARTAIFGLIALGTLATITIGGGALLIAGYLPARFQHVAWFVALLSLAVPLKAGATGYGTRLIASRRFDAPLLVNAIELAALSLILMIGATPLRCGLAVIGGAALSLGSLAWLDHRPMRRT